ncbi:hypothetical protein B0T22DRAFT_483660 [Podospora appendiculata]|uniref:Uncharacterized protein n=1 Tax=Podospora appendiculata TaxID=314037 RepID=A0AAE1C992_9PEZI|nr:hypothetical protein B0T22DRAFT_483660 [Podospora appendiculata]
MPQGTRNPLPAVGIKRHAADPEPTPYRQRASKRPMISAVTGGPAAALRPMNTMAISRTQPTAIGGTLGSTAYTIDGYHIISQFLVAPQPPNQQSPTNYPIFQPMVSIPFDSVITQLAAEAAQHVCSAYLRPVFAMQDEKIRGLGGDVGALRDEVRELRKDNEMLRAEMYGLPDSPVQARSDSGEQDWDDYVILEDAHGAALHAAAVSARGATKGDGMEVTDGVTDGH